MKRSLVISGVAAAALFPSVALAQDNSVARSPADAATGAGQPDGSATAAPASPQADPGSAIVVTGTRVRSDDILGNVNVLGGDSLVRDVRPTIWPAAMCG